MSSNWRNRLRPIGKTGGARDRITGKTGKSIEDETVAARPVIAERRSNVRGAKGPCCTECRNQQGRQGRDDKGVHQSARPETKTIRQGEDRTNLAVLGFVCARLQEGDPSGSLSVSQSQRRSTGN